MHFKATLTLTILLFLLPAGVGAQSIQAQEKPLKVFVLVGQSNMQGHAHVRTLPHLGMDGETQSILEKIQTEEGEARVFDDIWISYLSSNGVKSGQLTTGFGADENKFGPELTFGIYMQEKLGEPILIIKAAWGGKSVHTDFRSPSAGPYVFNQSTLDRLKQQGKDIDAIKAEKIAATGIYYRQTVDHVNKVLDNIKSVYPGYDENLGYELSGMVWFQGWNDLVDSGTYPNRNESGGYDQYSEVLGHMIRDFRKDLSAPNLQFVVGVLGVGGPTEKYSENKKRHKQTHQNFRDAMAAPASLSEFEGNVVNVLTENFWDSELEDLVTRDNEIKNKLKKQQKEGTLDQKDWQATLTEHRAKKFSELELETMNIGISNAAYHYLGSSKIMTRIGQGFAEALFDSNE